MMPLMSEEDKFEMMPIFFFTIGPNMRQDQANQSRPAFRICLEFNEKTREYRYW